MIIQHHYEQTLWVKYKDELIIVEGENAVKTKVNPLCIQEREQLSQERLKVLSELIVQK